MTQQTFAVTGLTCGHCVQAVTSELKEVPGVTEVTIDLEPGGTSQVQVNADHVLSENEVAAALDEAGAYTLVS